MKIFQKKIKKIYSRQKSTVKCEPNIRGKQTVEDIVIKVNALITPKVELTHSSTRFPLFVSSSGNWESSKCDLCPKKGPCWHQKDYFG